MSPNVQPGCNTIIWLYGSYRVIGIVENIVRKISIRSPPSLALMAVPSFGPIERKSGAAQLQLRSIVSVGPWAGPVSFIALRLNRNENRDESWAHFLRQFGLRSRLP